MNENRLHEIDFIRAVVTLFVIGIHVSADYVLTSKYALLWNRSMGNAVPIFIILSGFVLIYSERDRTTHFLVFEKKRLKKIILPYLFWSIFYFYAYKLYFSPTESYKEAGIRLVKGIINGNTLYHLYFLVVLLFLYLLFPALKKMIGIYPKALLFLSIIGFILSTHYTDRLKEGLGVYGWYQPLNWLIYFVFGMFTLIYLDNLKKLVIRKEVFWLMLGLVTYVVYYKQSTSMIFPGINNAYFGAVYSIISFYVLFGIGIQFFELDIKPFKRIVMWISKHSFLMYLTHPFVLLILYILSRHFNKVTGFFDGTKGMGIKYLVVILSTIIITYLISAIPFSDIVGARPIQFKKRR